MDFERRESLKHVLAEQSKKMLEASAEGRRRARGRDPAHFISAARRRDSEAARLEDSRNSQLRSRRDL